MKLRSIAPFIAGLLASLVFGWWLLPGALHSSQPQPVQFSHALHTGEKVGMSCQDCHGFDEHGAFAGIPKLDQCASCHAEPAGTTDEERRFVEQYVKPHLEVPWGVFARQPDNVYFSHASHVKEAGIDCARCHGDHGKTESLRPVQANLISGYSRDIEGGWISGKLRHNPRELDMNGCVACHAEHGRESACIDCHK